MVGQLSREEIDTVLGRLSIGRIGYCVDGRPRVLPVTYAYDGTAVYVASGPGEKIDAMRVQPRVCFEVDEINGSAIWRSVIADGIYEELTSERDRCAAVGRISRAMGVQTPYGAEGSDAVIVFRIRLFEMTGRFGREL